MYSSITFAVAVFVATIAACSASCGPIPLAAYGAAPGGGPVAYGPAHAAFAAAYNAGAPSQNPAAANGHHGHSHAPYNAGVPLQNPAAAYGHHGHSHAPSPVSNKSSDSAPAAAPAPAPVAAPVSFAAPAPVAVPAPPPAPVAAPVSAPAPAPVPAPVTIPAPPCPKNYIFSCQPQLRPAPCAQAATRAGFGGAGSYSNNYFNYALPPYGFNYQSYDNQN
ncbi:vitelline membrane protein Vm26Ab-like [Musca vetustissima]|uniref:vitelline membrane protein Vm26Ab-like n=1 Tax=Musca vetustissima TaxID=27455 RepID=UPI002AB63AF7|nr:vitelline membrane protein Vm26Ab-like [Musca vetustissima]